MIARVRAFVAWWSRRRVAYAGASVVAASNAAISYVALSATTRAMSVPDPVSWLFPFGADGIIAVTTPVAIELRDAPWWVKVQVWGLLLGAVAVSVVGNAARAPVAWSGQLYGVPIPTGDAVWLSIPPLAYAGSLHALGLMHRYAPAKPVRARKAAHARTGAAARRVRRPEPRQVVDGREVSAAHARKLRARAGTGAAA